jgi:hypothetical protein
MVACIEYPEEFACDDIAKSGYKNILEGWKRKRSRLPVEDG